MKIGDAEIELWIEGESARSYLVFVQSLRRGGLRYRWWVERWRSIAPIMSAVLKSGTAKTLDGALATAIEHATKAEARALMRARPRSSRERSPRPERSAFRC